MAWATDRILVYDRSLAFLFEIVPDEVTKRERTEELNGTHELELVTSRVLHEGYRLLTVDGTGKWREHVVYKPDEGHENGDHATGTYVCMWSIQYDLTSTVQGNVAQPGMGSDCTSEVAVRDAIGGQSIWTVGTCDVGKVDAGKGCVMVGNNAWSRLKQVVATWGGEVDAVITVSSTKVISRTVELRKHLGSTMATRRFDWGEDLTKIHRTPDPGPYFCRVMPFGRGQREYAEDDETEFDWPSDVTEEPYSSGDGWVHDNGSAFVRDPEAEAVFRTSDGHGGWHYPTKEVKYDEDDPELLLNEATADIHNHTRPGVSYEADVLQFAEAGMDAQGVALGDDVQCVDYGFNPDAALRVQGRITRMVVNELAPKTDTKLTIGDLGTSFAATLKDLISSSTQGLKQRLNHIEGGGTIAYVENLLESINAEINALGGYAYIVEGEGIITYDIAVDDPLVGYNSKTHTWASRVTQMKGGTIRFANTKNASFSGISDWKWTNVITADGYLGLAATIGALTAGYIGNADDDFWINLDTHEYRMPGGTTFGGSTVQQIAQTAVDNQTQAQIFNKLTNNGAIQGLYMEGGNLYVNASYIKTGTMNAVRIESNDGESYWDLDTGQMQLYSKDTNLKIGRFTQTAGGNLIDSLIELGDGMTYTNRYGDVFKLYVDSYESQSGSTTYRNAHMQLTNTQGTAGFYLDTQSLQGSVMLRSDATFYILGGHDAMNDNRTRVVINNNGTRPMCDIYGTTRANVTAWSDRRMKKHVEYLDEDACDFVRALRPALFEFRKGTHQSGRHLGFYAQDVMDAEPDGWDTETVTQSADESLDYRPYSLDYSALIAPLVAYTQQLERRIDQQQEQIDALTARLDALEGGA